jgi:predicted ATPase
MDKSLLERATPTQRQPEPRLTMLETVREYGLERLSASGEAAVIRRQHACLYVELVEGLEPRLAGAEQAVWLERLEQDHANLRAALEWSQGTDGDTEIGLRLAGALWRFWWVRGHLTEGRQWLEAALARGADAPAALRAKALHGAGNLALPQGDYARAMAC